jgi:hypothetical protein
VWFVQSSMLHNMLAVLRAKGVDTYRMYKNAGYLDLLDDIDSGIIVGPREGGPI